jgi:hypothetical protein
MFALLHRLFGRRVENAAFTLHSVTPEMIGCNEVVRSFCESPLDELEISPEAIARGDSALLASLHALDFARVRNRFRVLGNLDPVRNRNEERGTLRFSYRTAGDLFRDAEIETVFPVSGDRFTIRKLTLSPPKPEAETECDGA